MRLTENLALEGKDMVCSFVITPGTSIPTFPPDRERPGRSALRSWFVDRLRTRMATNEDGTPAPALCRALRQLRLRACVTPSAAAS
jgi:hypothetical protein